MGGSIPKLNLPDNEPVLSYAPGTPERAAVKAKLEEFISQAPLEIPCVIGGERVYTGNIKELRAPHDHDLVLAKVHLAGKEEALRAIEAAKEAWQEWSRMPWYQRIAIFLKAAEILAGPKRQDNNAATMLGQSKNIFQAEIDSACELIDFWRFNAYYAYLIYTDQPPISSRGVWNRLEYRPLEGFIFAVTPFNFTSIGGNLPTAPALMGNVAVWKPTFTQTLSAWVTYLILEEAGLPPGVINLIHAEPPQEVGEVCLTHPDLAGLHFTGSTKTFQFMFRTIGENIDRYRSYPRIVGETGGKDFVFAHRSADVEALITALSRGAFEYQGQKCSAASRAYIPQSLWEEVREGLLRDISSMKMGDVRDFSNFLNAVIDEKAFNKITGYLERVKQDKEDAEILIGGGYDRSKGWFIEPTVVLAKRPDYVTMCEEIFGPVLSVYVYPDEEYENYLEICNQTSPYGLTGSIFAQDRYAVELAERILTHAAGNFYINDKPTGAVVAQQPFGGSRKSGTNDKAGSWLNLIRWVSPRAIKETFTPPKDFRYPFMEES